MRHWKQVLIVWSAAALVVGVGAQILFHDFWFTEMHVLRTDGFDGIERTFSWAGPAILCIPALAVFLVGLQRTFRAWERAYTPGSRGAQITPLPSGEGGARTRSGREDEGLR